METIDPPHATPQATEFMRVYAHALRWTVGLFTHWHWVPPETASCWHFFCHPSAREVRAVLLYLERVHWWGIVARDPDSAVKAFAKRSREIPIRFVEGDRAHVEALEQSESLLPCGARREPSLVLRRRPAKEVGPLPAGFREARKGDIPAILAYHRQNPGWAAVPSWSDIAYQIEKGVYFVQGSRGSVHALARVTPGGGFRCISDVYTFAPFRRQGHAHTLMRGVLSRSDRAGEDACLCVEATNQPALALYQGLGFSRWDERLVLIWNKQR